MGLYPDYQAVIKVADIINVIMNAGGVDDFVPTRILCRADATPFANAYVIYDVTANINNRHYYLTSAFATKETTTGQGWFDIPIGGTHPNIELLSA